MGARTLASEHTLLVREFCDTSVAFERRCSSMNLRQFGARDGTNVGRHRHRVAGPWLCLKAGRDLRSARLTFPFSAIGFGLTKRGAACRSAHGHAELSRYERPLSGNSESCVGRRIDVYPTLSYRRWLACQTLERSASATAAAVSRDRCPRIGTTACAFHAMPGHSVRGRDRCMR